jgi:hypothetical protein
MMPGLIRDSGRPDLGTQLASLGKFIPARDFKPGIGIVITAILADTLIYDAA